MFQQQLSPGPYVSPFFQDYPQVIDGEHMKGAHGDLEEKQVVFHNTEDICDGSNMGQ